MDKNKRPFYLVNLDLDPVPQKPLPTFSWTCDKCPETFSSYSDLVSHRRLHGPGSRCEHCSTEFRNSSTLTRHIWRIHPETVTTPWRCPTPTCDMPFRSNNALQKHIKIVHMGITPKNKRSKCHQCGESFAGLSRHKEVHGPGFKCSDCGAEYSLRRNLNHHRSKIHGVKRDKSDFKPVPCGKCGGFYLGQRSLEGHLKTHWNGKGPKCSCSRCGASFNKACALSRHQCRVEVTEPWSQLEYDCEEDEEDNLDMDPLKMEVKQENEKEQNQELLSDFDVIKTEIDPDLHSEPNYCNDNQEFESETNFGNVVDFDVDPIKLEVSAPLDLC